MIFKKASSKVVKMLLKKFLRGKSLEKVSYTFPKNPQKDPKNPVKNLKKPKNFQKSLKNPKTLKNSKKIF